MKQYGGLNTGKYTATSGPQKNQINTTPANLMMNRTGPIKIPSDMPRFEEGRFISSKQEKRLKIKQQKIMQSTRPNFGQKAKQV